MSQQNNIYINPKYQPLLTDKNSRYFIVTGGRGSGKSFAVSLAIVLLCLQEDGLKVLYTRYTLESAGTSIIPEFIEKLDMLGIKARITKTTIEFWNGSKIYFKGIKTSSGNQTANLKSLANIGLWVLDEAEELIDEPTFDRINESIRTKTHQNRVWLIMNPTTAEHFIYKRFFERGPQSLTRYIHTTYLDNLKNLDESFLAIANDLKENNPKAYELRYLGQWLERPEGVVFTNWEEGKFDTSLQYLFGQDYGFVTDPTTLVKCAFDHKRKIMYLHECYYQKGLITSQIAALNNIHVKDKELIIGDSAEKRLIYELINDYRQNVVGINKSLMPVKDGILLMLEYKMVVSPTSYNLKKELNSFVYLDRGAGLTIDAHNHCIDSIRYALIFSKFTNVLV